jgi:hypothetical protein
MLWTVHRDPFQPSAKGAGVPLLSYDPTAMQTRTEGHDTPLSPLPAGRGARWIDHCEPFQRSTNAPSGPDPTAVHVRLDTHDTPLSPPPVVLWVSGVG